MQQSGNENINLRPCKESTRTIRISTSEWMITFGTLKVLGFQKTVGVKARRLWSEDIWIQVELTKWPQDCLARMDGDAADCCVLCGFAGNRRVVVDAKYFEPDCIELRTFCQKPLYVQRPVRVEGFLGFVSNARKKVGIADDMRKDPK